MNVKLEKHQAGLAVMRCQPLHKGHCTIINEMIQECKTSIVCIGSAQLSKQATNPYTVEDRIQMLRNVYSDRIKIIPLNDIGAASAKQWVSYICEKIEKLGLQQPSRYYTGSVADAQWYKHHFFNPTIISGWASDVYESYEGRTLHIIERENNIYPPATELRTFLHTRNPGWKKYVPLINHDLVLSGYPDDLKVPLD